MSILTNWNSMIAHRQPSMPSLGMGREHGEASPIQIRRTGKAGVLKKVGNYLFIIIVAILVISPGDHPAPETHFAVSIRTWSMVPVFTRGIWFSFSPRTNTNFSPGQIIFRSEEHGIRVGQCTVSWTLIRRAFITKGT